MQIIYHRLNIKLRLAWHAVQTNNEDPSESLLQTEWSAVLFSGYSEQRQTVKAFILCTLLLPPATNKHLQEIRHLKDRFDSRTLGLIFPIFIIYHVVIKKDKLFKDQLGNIHFLMPVNIIWSQHPILTILPC